ncbi:MAG: 3-keto-disaccharide hydrolase [Roseibacillus sp.]
MKTLLSIATIFFSGGLSCAEPLAEEGFETIFNGKDWEGWYLKIRSGDEELAKKVFAIEEGVIHVFNDQFPDDYEVDKKDNKTHGMLYYEKKCSHYVLRFDYKWGDKKANNFEEWQYDAGVYYHVIDDSIWPTGIEYQIRYDHTKDRNHTGDLIRPGKVRYDWFCADDFTYLHPDEGGKPEQEVNEKKQWLHYASHTDNHHALDGQWNACEIIVMGDQFAIHKLNGEVVNMAFNLEPSTGIFGFQSETAEIFYRNIRLKEFEEPVPAKEFLGEDSTPVEKEEPSDEAGED